MANFEKTNTVEIIGTLKDVNLVEKTDRNANDYVSGTITIEAELDGVKNDFEVELYSRKLTQDKKESKLYSNYVELKQQVGQRIRATGSLTESRYFNKTTNLLASTQRISGRFINAEKNDVPDKATFEFGGFVTKPLEAKTRKDSKEVYTYELSVGQANYDDKKLSIFRFNIDPENVNIVKAVNSLYGVNKTIHFGGELRFITTQNEVKTEAAFGEARTRIFTNTMRNYFITWGNEPVQGEGMYDANTIATLNGQYNTRDMELISENQNNNNVLGTATTISSVQTSLI